MSRQTFAEWQGIDLLDLALFELLRPRSHQVGSDPATNLVDLHTPAGLGTSLESKPIFFTTT
jgi:hypothetical protein